MLFPALIGLAFGTQKNRRRILLSEPTKSPQEIDLELRELLPEITQTIEIAELYFNALEDGNGDTIDIHISTIILDLRRLRTLLTEGKSRGVFALFLKIRREIEKIPKMLRYFMYHSKRSFYQAELAEIARQFDSLVQKDSLLSDILKFLQAYFVTRWKGVEDLVSQTTHQVNQTLEKK